MSIVKMKKLRLVVLREQRDKLLRELMRLGCLEIHEPRELMDDPEQGALLTSESAGAVQLRAEQSELERALAVLDRYAPQKKKLLSPRPAVAEAIVLDEAALQTNLLLAERILSLEEGVRRQEAEEARLRTQIQTLRPWESLDVALDFRGTRSVAALFGSLDGAKEPELLYRAAEGVSEAVQFFRVSGDDKQHCFLVLCMKDERDEMLSALQMAGFVSALFGERKDTARRNIRALEKELRAAEEKRASLEREIIANGASRRELETGLDRMTLLLLRAETAERLCGKGSVLALEGWYPAESEAELQALLDGFDCAWESRDPREEEYPEVPVKLKNRALVRPLNMVTNMYGLPAYDGIDPNPLMAPFFVLYYGVMMADMGYGLVMLLAALVMRLKMKPKGGMKDFVGLLTMGGLSTFIFGALTGGFFGDFLPQLAKLINPDTSFTALPALFTPLEDTMSILIASLVIGLVQVLTGMAVSVWKKCKDGAVLEAVFDEVTWWVLLLGVGLMVLKLGNVGGVPVVLALGGAMLVVGQFVLKKSFAGGLVGIFASIYNGVTGLFSDILSYSRLMALMLSGSIIATVFNTLGAIPGKVIFFVLVSFLGNALNFALNILGCYVHDLRLQCLEFFGRFYKDGGRPWKPLNMETKYVDIIKEET